MNEAQLLDRLWRQNEGITILGSEASIHAVKRQRQRDPTFHEIVKGVEVEASSRERGQRFVGDGRRLQ